MTRDDLNSMIKKLHDACSTDEVTAVRLAADVEREVGRGIRLNINPWGFELYLPADAEEPPRVPAHLVMLAFRIVTDDGRLLKSRRRDDRVLRAASR